MPVFPSDPLDTTPVSSLIADVYTHLEPSSFGYLNRLTEDVDDDDTSIVFDFGNQAAVRPGAYLCVDIEVLYVWDYDDAAKTATVQRAMLGSVAAAHAAGALVQIQPRVSSFDVLKQLRYDVQSWPPSLYRTTTIEVSVGAASRGYELDAVDAYRVLSVTYTPTGGTAPLAVSGWRVDFDADVDIYPSGKAIIFPAAFGPATVDVTYAAPFITDEWALDTLLADLGLTPSMYEIPVLGAAARLIREAPRTDTRAQGQSRLAEEVPPMHRANASKDLMRRRDDRIHQEIARLREKYPQRRA